jgi:membrane-associated phospholipid phosphatase
MVRRRWREPDLRILVYVLLGITVAITVISLVGPNIDLALANLFYNPTSFRRFVGIANPYLIPLREHGMIAIGTCALIVILALMSYLPGRLPSVPPRAAIALTLSLIIGPGIMVNGILKPYGGRPRPVEVTQFGGNLQFVDWWNPTGSCRSNCSFMSGEATTAAWMVGPAMLVPPPWRTVAIGAALVFAGVVGALRIVAGAHFFTDVLVGILAMIVIVLAVNRLFGIRNDAAR